MAFTTTLRRDWRKILDAMSLEDEREKLLEKLREQYCTEAHNAAQFTAHARRMYYPQFRDRLLRIAAEERAHLKWLGEQIRALEGEVPEPSVTPKFGHNSWECLLLDLEEERRNCADLVSRIHTAARVDPDIAGGLLHIRLDEQRHHEELREMLMKSDPYTPSTPKVPNEELEQYKQEWLAQQKMQWFEQQRAEWEAGGKLVTWEEWEGELEHRWIVNELPSLDLVWTRRVAEEEFENLSGATL